MEITEAGFEIEHNNLSNCGTSSLALLATNAADLEDLLLKVKAKRGALGLRWKSETLIIRL